MFRECVRIPKFVYPSRQIGSQVYRVCVITRVLVDGFVIKRPKYEQWYRSWKRLDVACTGVATNASASDRWTGSHVGDATVDRYRWRVNARSGSVLDGRRFPGELIFYGSKGFFDRGLAWFRSLRFRWVTRRDREERIVVHVRHIPVGIGDSNMAARTSRDRWVRGSHVGRCARLEITSSRSWNARGW